MFERLRSAVDVKGTRLSIWSPPPPIPKRRLDRRSSFFLGQGHGEFTPAAGSPFPVGTDAYRLTVGDVNEDGKTRHRGIQL
jgi:hypothetical protein